MGVKRPKIRGLAMAMYGRNGKLVIVPKASSGCSAVAVKAGKKIKTKTSDKIALV